MVCVCLWSKAISNYQIQCKWVAKVILKVIQNHGCKMSSFSKTKWYNKIKCKKTDWITAFSWSLLVFLKCFLTYYQKQMRIATRVSKK